MVSRKRVRFQQLFPVLRITFISSFSEWIVSTRAKQPLYRQRCHSTRRSRWISLTPITNLGLSFDMQKRGYICTTKSFKRVNEMKMKLFLGSVQVEHVVHARETSRDVYTFLHVRGWLLFASARHPVTLQCICLDSLASRYIVPHVCKVIKYLFLLR